MTNKTLPLLAVRDVVVYPHTQIALFVGRAPSISAVNLSENDYNGEILLISQKDSLSEEIDVDNLSEYGTVCRIISTMPHETDKNCLKVLLEGIFRAKVEAISTLDDDTLMGDYSEAALDNNINEEELDARKDMLLQVFAEYAENTLRNHKEINKVAQGFEDLTEVLYFIATRTSLDLDKKLELLTINDLQKLYDEVIEHLIAQKAEQELESELAEQVRRQMESNQREYYLNEKMKAIKTELSDLNGDDDDSELEKRLKEADLPDEVRKKSRKRI